MKLKRKNFIYYLIFVSIFLLNLTSFAENKIKFKEDIEIEKIKQEILLLENKIKRLEKIKQVKNNDLIDNSNLKIGLALSGGGAKGYAHLGVLKVLEENNIKIDYITGTSIGALVGTLYSIGYSINEIEKILDRLNVENFLETGNDISSLSIEEKENLRNYGFYINYDNHFKFSLPEGIKNNNYMYLELKKLLKDSINHRNFEELPIPIRIIATDLNTGKTRAFEKGDLAKVLTASMAIPGIIEPVKINGDFYVDGLVSRNLPVQDNYDMGSDIVIASDISKDVEIQKKFNIFSVINQIMEIQSANSITKERKKATILIRPNIQDISAINTSKKKELIGLGKKAAESNLDLLSKLPKKIKQEAKIKEKNKEIFIKNIIYSKNLKKNTINILEDTFANFINKKINEKTLEEKISEISALKYLKNINYYVHNNSLYISGEDDYQNKLGLSFQYKTGYGTTLNLGTDIHFNNILGSSIYANAKVGDYFGLKFSASSYYGATKKIGAFANLGYDESPFFLYKNTSNKKSKRIAKYLNRELSLDMGIYTQPTKNTYIAYGLNSKLINLKLDTGDNKAQKLEYSKNINKTYLKMKYDSLDSISFPMSGIKADFIYTFSSSLGKTRTDLYGPSYIIKGYKPINKKLSLMYGLKSAILKGKNIKANQYIKLGGIGDNIENNEFEFYGFNFQEKSVDKFLSMSIGLRYKPIYSLYLSAKLNSTTFSDSKFNSGTKNKMWKDFYKGVAFSAGYNSPIGPIELSISSNLKERSPIASISIGYTLD